MPFLAPAIIGALAAAMTSLVGRVLLALGIGFVSYSGIDTLISNLTSAIQGNMTGIPASLWSWMAILKVQTSISIITSAFSTRVAMVAIGGTIKRAVFK